MGGAETTVLRARSQVTKYLTQPGWSYPAYDDYPGGGHDLLTKSDLLAPVLLNLTSRYLSKYCVLANLLD